jgi:hypothetical protein
VDDGYAILLYYAPALLLNCQTNYQRTHQTTKVSPELIKVFLHLLSKQKSRLRANFFFKIGLVTMYRLFKISREAIKDREGNGVFTVDIASVAERAKSPQTLESMEMQLNFIADDAIIAVL